MKHLLPILAMFTMAASCALAQGRPEQVVKEVRIKRVGPGLVDEGFVSAHIGVKAGRNLEPGQITADVKSLLATGRFTDVKVEIDSADGKTVLIYNVQGRLTLSGPVAITGEKHFSAEKIRELLKVEAGDLVDEAMLSARGQNVLKEYHGDDYVDADLQWSVKVVDETNGLATADLQVKEGTRATIGSIAVTGNKRVPGGVLEEAAGRTPWWNLWELLFESKKFDKDQIEAGRTAIRAACAARGYLDAQVGEPELTRRRSGSCDVRYRVEEGLLYRVGAVAVKGVTLFPEIELTRLIGFKKGSVASPEAIYRTGDAIRKYFTDRGYARTTVNTALDARRDDRPGEGVLDITFTVTEGALVHVRNVFIRGNEQTKEKVIRRELEIFPGDILAERNVVISENRLRNLGYFSRVANHPEPAGRPDEADLVFDVEEQRTGAFMVGGGFSSVDNLVGYFDISEGNFDIGSWPPKGGGQKIKVHGQLGSKSTQGNITFIEPWFMDRRLLLQLDLYANTFVYDQYDSESVGAAITLGWPVHFFFDRCEAKYSLEDARVTDITHTNTYRRITGDRVWEPFTFASTNRIKSSLSATLLRDTRDDVFVPSRGHRISVKGYVAGGFLGGDEDVYGWEVKAEKHFPLWANHVLSFKGRAEVVDEYGHTGEMPISDRFFAGGAGWARGIRGFNYREVGPKVVRVVPGTYQFEYQPIGGRTLAIGTVEYAIPLVEKLKLVLFADSGNVNEEAYDFGFKSMATSAGLELRLDYRLFPIRVNYGWALKKDDCHTEEHPWGFALGSGF